MALSVGAGTRFPASLYAHQTRSTGFVLMASFEVDAGLRRVEVDAGLWRDARRVLRPCEYVLSSIETA